MILVDVLVPVTGRVYDFTIEENVAVKTVTEDIVDLIVQKEGYSNQGDSEMRLFSHAKRMQLEEEKTLFENGVRNGDKLILV